MKNFQEFVGISGAYWNILTFLGISRSFYSFLRSFRKYQEI
jgi:hypothetical protein